MCALALAGCGSGTDTVVAELQLQVLPGCAPEAGADTVRLEALGDFPSSESTVEILDPGDGMPAIDRFPPGTRVLTAIALADGYAGAGARFVPDRGGDLPLLVLPFGRSCALRDRESYALPGAAVAPTADGGLLIFGGIGEDIADRRVALVPPGGAPAVIGSGDLEPRRRNAATATVVGDRVVVAGGAVGREGLADETFEIYDARGRLLALHPLCDAGVFCNRRDHGATALPDGRVLLAGGVPSVPGTVLTSAVALDPRSGAVTPVGDLPSPRRSPSLVTLDDGTVLAVGGFDEDGAPTGSILAFDPASGTFSPALFEDGEEATVPPHDDAVLVPLEGARFAWLGGGVRTIVLVERVAPTFGAPVLRRIEHPGSIPSLVELKAITLDDGSLLVTGLDATTPTPPTVRSYLVDLGLGVSHEVRPPACAGCDETPPQGLVRLADGTIVELSPEGIGVRRETLRTAWDSPPNSLPLLGVGDEPGLAFDSALQWRRDRNVFVAIAEGARVDLTTLRFETFDVIIEVDGAAEVLLTPALAPPVVIRLGEELVGPALCEAPRLLPTSASFIREGTQLTVEGGGDSRACTLPELVGPVSVSLRLSLGARLLRLQVTRR